MEWLQIVEGLKIAIDLTEIGLKVKEYFLSKPSEFDNPEVQKIIHTLPVDATPAQIIDALTPIYEQRASLIFKAGDNNGGDLHLKNVRAESEAGTKIIVGGGDGGELGKGGNTFVSNSTFSGGKKSN